MSRQIPIDQMQIGERIAGVFAINNCQLGQTKTGKPFIRCLISDSSKRVPGRMWNASPELFAELPTDGFVEIEGETQAYQGELQIIIHDIRAMKPSAEMLANLLPSTQYDVDEMFDEVRKIMDTLEHPALRELSLQYLDDAQLMDLFKQAPAAMELHHAYLGGLLEHTRNLLRLVDRIAPLYPQLSRDVLLMGAFLHDLGKCVELTWTQGFGYSEEGQLVGHIARGVMWLDAKAEACAANGKPLPTSLLNVLQHMILSHHGRPEYGALKIPSTPEAIALHYIDNLDAKMEISLRAAQRDQPEQDNKLGGAFTEKIWALETRLFRPDPTLEND